MTRKNKSKKKKEEPIICSGVSLRFVFDHVIQSMSPEHITFIVWNGHGDGDLVKMPIAGLPYRIRKIIGKQNQPTERKTNVRK